MEQWARSSGDAFAKRAVKACIAVLDPVVRATCLPSNFTDATAASLAQLFCGAQPPDAGVDGATDATTSDAADAARDAAKD